MKLAYLLVKDIQDDAPNSPAGHKWNVKGPVGVFNHSVTLPPPPAADKGHVYRYTAARHNSNGQIVSLRQSDPFILL